MTLDPTFPSDFYVVDVGMHNGNDSLYYAKRGFKVIAYEANPDLARAGREQFLSLGVDVEVRNRAISDQTAGTALFYVNNKSSQWSSLNPDLGMRDGGATSVEVEVCNLANDLDSICDKIHMIKIDIEGFDLTALRQLSRLKSFPPYISVENGGLAFLDIFCSMNYTRFKYSNQKYNSLQKIPKISPHGEFMQHFFHPHSSGPFGEDLPGRWLTLDEAKTVSQALDSGRNLARGNLWAESIGWFDLHAAK